MHGINEFKEVTEKELTQNPLGIKKIIEETVVAVEKDLEKTISKEEVEIDDTEIER